MKSIATNRIPEVVSDLLAPQTSGLRDVPRCGALSLLQKTPRYRGDPAKTAARLNVRLCDLRGGGGDLPLLKAAEIKSRDSEIKSRRGAGNSRGIRGCWFVLLFRTLPPAAQPASPVAPPSAA